MHSLRKYIQVISAFLLINFLYATFIPTISYALTSGPTAPEATSFEPIDTTDMVNLQTGDFTYNIPLLEVPGPSGGYPLSLSYHAGIMPNEEASWVGLGWTLNPGAIHRTVNGYPDDHHGAERKVTDTWEGASRSTFSVGMGLPGASYDLSFSQDTYKGFGLGTNVSIGYTFGKNGNGLNIGIAAGNDGYGRSHFGPRAGLTFGNGLKQAEEITGSISLSTNFRTVSANANVGLRQEKTNQSLLGVSLSSSGGAASASVAGVNASQVNSNAGKIQTSGYGFNIPVPLGTTGLFANLGYNYTRYWSHEESEVNTYGALYPSWQDPDNNSYDSFALLDPDAEGGIVENSEADKVLGGSMAAFDSYSVNAQGLSGSMRPYSFFMGSLYRQNVKKVDSEEYLIEYENKSTPHSKMNYRFDNDFSNAYYYGKEDANKPQITQNISSGLTITHGGSTKEGDGWDYTTQRLAGSRHIEWVTNQEVRNGYDGLILPTNRSNWELSKFGYNISDQIGAYIITNANGIKFHYAQPVYSYDELIHTKANDSQTTNTREHPQPYAYTWYLTAVTGPDYVDKNNNGMLDEGDWGYWVKFDYGKWTDQYTWRNPGSGFHKDLDANFQSFSSGKKEIYYLDAISTKTHTALFIKDIRHDAKGGLGIIPVKVFDSNNSFAYRYTKFNSESLNGGFIPKEITTEWETSAGSTLSDVTYFARPTSTLKLKDILLFENDKLEALNLEKFSGTTHLKYIQNYNHTWNPNNILPWHHVFPQQEDLEINFIHHQPSNVFDVDDIPEVAYSNVLRQIELETDYSLMPETENSFDYELVNKASPSSNAQDYPRFGKLTLNALTFKGKRGANHIPPMQFGYDLENPLNGYGKIRVEDNKTYLDQSGSGLVEGDLIKLFGGGKDYYALVKQVSGSAHELKKLGKNLLADKSELSWKQTKNPPYNRDFVDMWGFYKSDFQSSENRNLDHLLFSRSAKSSDVFSLRKVSNSIGSSIHIGLEADEYNQVELEIAKPFLIEGLSGFETAANDTGNLYVDLSRVEESVSDIFSIGDKLSLGYSILWDFENVNNCLPGSVPPAISSGEAICTILDLGPDYIRVSAPKLAADLEETSTTSGCFEITRYFGGGILGVTNVKIGIFGGGVRCSSIKIENQLAKSKITKFSYSNGVTSFEPFEMGYYKVSNPDNIELIDNWSFALKYALKNIAVNKFSDLLANSRILPAPGVMYKNVTVSEYTQSGIESPIKAKGEIAYEFQTFEKEMINRREIAKVGTETWPARSLAFSDHTSGIGSLLSVSQHDLNGDRISHTANNYLKTYENPEGLNTLETNFSNQGLISEAYVESRKVEEEGQIYKQSILTVSEEFPSIQIGQTTTDYKTGITTTSQNLAFDFYSGTVTRKRSTDGYGNTFESESVPAYRVVLPDNTRAYSNMGLAIGGGKNMLTQTAANYTWKIDPNNGSKQAVISANIQTWNDKWKYRAVDGDWANADEANDAYPVWRKHESYSYTGGQSNLRTEDDGLTSYNPATFQDFTQWRPTDGEPGAQWQKNSEITLYDRYSHALEAMDINGNFAATKMDNREEKVLATVANATYLEFAYSGAEDWDGTTTLGGGVTWETGAILSKQDNSYDTHTGDKVLGLVAGNKGFTFVSSGLTEHRKYKISVWSNKEGLDFYTKVNNATAQIIEDKRIRQADGWYLHEAYVIPPDGVLNFEVYCQATEQILLDDFRFHPIDAPMTAYVYNEYDELAFVLDNNNLYTEYQYDDMGRLESTYRESFKYGRKKVSEYAVHYSTIPTSNK